LAVFTRTVCPRRLGTSLARAKMRILPWSSRSKPSGGEDQPMSTCPDIKSVMVAAGPPVAVGVAFSPSSLIKPSTTLWLDEPLVE
jgi:hypothetical protein